MWPETPVGEFATFSCPLSPGFTVERECGNGGEWQLFDELGCGDVNVRLIELKPVFTNVCYHSYCNVLHVCISIHTYVYL